MPAPPSLLHLAVLATLFALIVGVQIWYWASRRRTRRDLREVRQIDVQSRPSTRSEKIQKGLLVIGALAIVALAISLEGRYGKWIMFPLAFAFAIAYSLITYVSKLWQGDPILRNANAMLRQEPAAAVELLQSCADDIPKWAAQRWSALGWALVNAEQYDAAVDAFDTATDRANRFGLVAEEIAARIGQVVAHFGACEPEMALEVAEQLARRLPDEPGTQYARALALHGAGRADEAAMAMKTGDDIATLASPRTLDPLTQHTIRTLAQQCGAAIGHGFPVEVPSTQGSTFASLQSRPDDPPHPAPDRRGA